MCKYEPVSFTVTHHYSHPIHRLPFDCIMCCTVVWIRNTLRTCMRIYTFTLGIREKRLCTVQMAELTIKLTLTTDSRKKEHKQSRSPCGSNSLMKKGCLCSGDVKELHHTIMRGRRGRAGSCWDRQHGQDARAGFNGWRVRNSRRFPSSAFVWVQYDVCASFCSLCILVSDHFCYIKWNFGSLTCWVKLPNKIHLYH